MAVTGSEKTRDFERTKLLFLKVRPVRVRKGSVSRGWHQKVGFRLVKFRLSAKEEMGEKKVAI